MAFGVAGSLAGGLLANFGSMTKPLHAANAARAGVLAAMLAGAGFTGSAQVLEHAAGFVQTHTVRSDSSAALCPLGEPWALSGMIYKFNAACSGTHSGGDGVRRLARQHGVTADDVARITIRVPRIQAEVANIQWPVTVEQAKFSIRFVAAAALLGMNVLAGGRRHPLGRTFFEPTVVTGRSTSPTAGSAGDVTTGAGRGPPSATRRPASPR